MLYEAFYGNSEWVNLSSEEVEAAIRHGMTLRKCSVGLNHKHAHGFNGDNKKSLYIQCLGSVAEAVVKKALNLKCELKNLVFKDSDLPGRIEVKSMQGNYFGLRVYPDTPDDRRVVGVIILPQQERGPTYRIVGWFNSIDAKKHCYAMDPGKRGTMYAVPQRSLKPLSDLRALIAPGQLQLILV